MAGRSTSEDSTIVGAGFYVIGRGRAPSGWTLAHDRFPRFLGEEHDERLHDER